MTSPKKVFIMRGVPGSGKSTWIANKIKDLNEKFPGIMCQVVSADHYFETDCGNIKYHSEVKAMGPMGQVWEAPCVPECSTFSKYKFDAKLLGAAHKQCQDGFVYAIGGDWPAFIFVDNTNLSVREMHFYVKSCINYGIEFVIVNVECDFNEAAVRNVHGVPPEKVKQMAKTMHKSDQHIPKEWPQINVRGT